MTPSEYRALRLQIAVQLLASDEYYTDNTSLERADSLIAANEARPVPQEVTNG